MHADEAGRCLDLAFAGGGKSDATRVVDLRDAALGSEFSHQTMLDRRERMRKEKQPVNPHEPVPIPESLCLNPTNVNVLWSQQQLYLEKFWCAIAKKQTDRIGATLPVQFGSRTHRHDWRLQRYHEQVFLPVIKQLSRVIVHEVGSKN